VGLQGALLSFFIPPIYMASVTVATGFHRAALGRALSGRLEDIQSAALPSGYRATRPALHGCAASDLFPRHAVIGCPTTSDVAPEEGAALPTSTAPPAVTCGYSICHSVGVVDEVIIAHRGVRQGVSPKQLRSGRGISAVAPATCLAEFWRTCAALSPRSPAASKLLPRTTDLTYGDLKALSADYQAAKAAVHQSTAFRDWRPKDRSFHAFKAPGGSPEVPTVQPSPAP